MIHALRCAPHLVVQVGGLPNIATHVGSRLSTHYSFSHCCRGVCYHMRGSRKHACVMQAIASAEFAIDPADPHVSRIKDPKAMIAKVSEKRRGAVPPQTKAAHDVSDHAGQGVDVKQLVSSLKRKQAPRLSSGSRKAQKAQK